MKRFMGTFVCVLLQLTAVRTAAQAFPAPSYFDQLFRPPRAATQVPGSQGVEEAIVDGKLTLDLDQTVRLMLLNSTDLRINQLQYQQSAFAIMKAYGNYD